MSQVKGKLTNRSMIVIVGVLIAILAIGGVWWWIHAGKVVSTDDARVKGTIVAVSAKVAGRVEKVMVQEGDIVEPGQVIVVLEKAELEAVVEQAKGTLQMSQAKLAEAVAGNRHQEVAQANATVNQTKASFDNANMDYERLETLYKKGAVSVQQRDTAKTAANVAQSQYASATEQYSLSAEGSRPEDIQLAQAQVRLNQGALTAAELQLANATVKAPVAGVVALKSVEDGEIIVVGQQVFSIANLSDVWISANIEETYIGRIKVGQPVEFTVDAYPDHKFTGHVSEVGSATSSQFALLATENSSSNFTKVTQRLPIKIKDEEADNLLKPGMSAVVNISTK